MPFFLKPHVLNGLPAVQYITVIVIVNNPEFAEDLYKEPNNMRLFVCVYSKICTLHVLNGYTVQHLAFMYHSMRSCLYTSS